MKPDEKETGRGFGTELGPVMNCPKKHSVQTKFPLETREIQQIVSDIGDVDGMGC